jgi:hypothetical protein
MPQDLQKKSTSARKEKQLVLQIDKAGRVASHCVARNCVAIGECIVFSQ